MSQLAIETRGLTKRFGAQTAVGNLFLSVPAGSVFGFLGPNGSGKTTTIRMLLGLITPSGGEASVLGQTMPGKLDDVLPHIGTLVEGPAFYPFLSGRANLNRLDSADRHAPTATRRARVQNALARVGLDAVSEKKVRAYSLGMKQRLGLANALLRPRELMILDEPTNGLDPQGTREVRRLVSSLTHDGTTVFVSSHLLAEVEQMCTHAAIMKAGKLVAQGGLNELRASGRSRVTLLTPDAGPAFAVLARLGLVPDTDNAFGVEAPAPDGATAMVSAWLPAGSSSPSDVSGARVSSGESGTSGASEVSGQSRAPEEIVAALVSAGVRVRGFTVDAGSLEDRFVELTGEGFDVAQ